jgi:DNA mismatch repair protein MutS
MPAEAVARAREILFELECARSVGEIEPSAERVALPELRAEIVPAAGTRQLDFFDAADHPIVAALRKLEVARITPLQAMQILDELSRAAREK